MTPEIRISDIIIPRYRPLFANRSVKHIILTSGRAGTKSSFAGIRSAFQIVSDPHGSVVVLRKHHNKLRKTVYKEMLRGINRMRIPKDRFKITKSPMEITYRKYQTTIYFTGSDSIDDTKGIIDEEKPIKLVILDELTEFFDDGEGEDELLNIEATFSRGNTGDFQMLYLYNPPKNPNSPINKWCRKMEQRPDCLHVHTDYRDVPVGWLGPDLIGSAEALRDVDERMYRWVWLGQSVGIDEAVYYMFSPKHVQRPPVDERTGKPKRYRMIGVGGDYGQQNATTFQAFGLDEYNHKIIGLDEFFHSGRDSGHQKSPSEYAQELIDLLTRLDAVYQPGDAVHCVFYVFLDPSAQGLKEEVKRATRSLPFSVMIRDAENDVKLGISRVQKLLTYDMLTISPMQKCAIDEFGTYEYDKKSIENGIEKPVKVDDHAMDAIRYLVMGFWKYVKAFLPDADKEEDE